MTLVTVLSLFAGSPFIWIVDRLETDILLVPKQAIELGMLPVKRKFGKEEKDIFSNKRTVAYVDVSGFRITRNEPSAFSEGRQMALELWQTSTRRVTYL